MTLTCEDEEEYEKIKIEYSDSEYEDDYGFDSDCDWREDDRYQSFAVYDCNGAIKQTDVKINSFKKLVNPNDLNNPFVDLHSRKYWAGKRVEVGGYMGNEGLNKYTFYRKCLLAFWSHDMSEKAQL